MHLVYTTKNYKNLKNKKRKLRRQTKDTDMSRHTSIDHLMNGKAIYMQIDTPVQDGGISRVGKWTKRHFSSSHR